MTTRETKVIRNFDGLSIWVLPVLSTNDGIHREIAFFSSTTKELYIENVHGSLELIKLLNTPEAVWSVIRNNSGLDVVYLSETAEKRIQLNSESIEGFSSTNEAHECLEIALLDQNKGVRDYAVNNKGWIAWQDVSGVIYATRIIDGEKETIQLQDQEKPYLYEEDGTTITFYKSGIFWKDDCSLCYWTEKEVFPQNGQNIYTEVYQSTWHPFGKFIEVKHNGPEIRNLYIEQCVVSSDGSKIYAICETKASRYGFSDGRKLIVIDSNNVEILLEDICFNSGISYMHSVLVPTANR